MTDAIGRGDYVLGADISGVRKGTAEAEDAIKDSAKRAEDEYAESGERAATRWSTAIKLGAKVTAGIVATGFALATKGVLELDNVVADFRAETGATADEADRAGDAINRMSSRNIQPVGEIGAALTKVHTDLGLVGDEAEVTTERFLRFARATRQDAASAVLAFDDILDAWNLTAEDSGAVMDYLIASHQKYGGSIEENQRQLALLAPQLRALNLTWQDGVNLLNLFAASGIDAAKGQQALNSAISNLPKGESLDQFIARLAKVEDDGARARMAIEVFGSRGGAALANAIKPGVASLDDFGFSLDEIEGKTEEAADVLDSTFGARAQLLLKSFASGLTGIGRELGPLVTAAGGLISLGGALGLDRAGGKIIEFFRNLGSGSGDAFAEGFGGVGVGASGTVAGNFIASRIETMVDSTKNSRIAAAIRAGGAKAGALFSAAFAIGMKLVDVIVAAIAASPAAGPVRAAVLTAGMVLGGAWGTATAAAFGAALLLGIPAAILFATENARNELLKDNPLGHPDRWLPPASEAKPIWELWGRENGRSAVNGIKGTFRDAGPEIAGAVEPTFKTVGSQQGRLFGFYLSTSAAQGLRDSHLNLARDLIGSLQEGGADLATVSRELARALPNALDDERSEIRRLAVLSMVDYAAGLRDKRAAIKAAIDLLGEDMENALGSKAERLGLQAELAGGNIAKGLKSKDPIVRAQAQGTVQLIVDRLRELGVDASTLGGKAGENYADALADTKPLVAGAADTSAGGATSVWDYYKRNAAIWGQRTGAAYAAALRATYGLVNDAANYVARGAVGPMKASSPPGPESPLHHIGDWATATIEYYASRIRAGRGAVASAFRHALDGSTGVLSADTVEIMAEARSLGIVRHEHHITAEGAANLAAAGFSPREVGAALAEGVGGTFLTNIRRLGAMTPG